MLPLVTTTHRPRATARRRHPAWWVAAFRAVPGVLIDPLHQEFGWSVATVSGAVAVKMALYGLVAPRGP